MIKTIKELIRKIIVKYFKSLINSYIQNISKKVSPDTLLLFWQFTIKTLDELDIVTNQELSIEMFLIRLLYLKNVGKKLFIPLVLTFIILGFLGELLYPLETNKDLFYLVIFYIVSPLFFVVQGIVTGMLYFSESSNNFS